MFISQLYVHPVKSAASMATESLNYTPRGPEFDREWMVVDDHGNFLSQRKLPSMCFIKADVINEQLTLHAPGMPSLEVEKSQTEQNTSHTDITIWHDRLIAKDCGDEAAYWLTSFLEKPCRLVRVDDRHPRLVDPDFANANQAVGFADGYPSLIVSQASLIEFNTHLHSPIDMRRFRPNIVISGCAAYAEDNWTIIRINGIEFDLVKPCSRCIMPSVNPDTAAKEMHINEALLNTRRRGRETYFGQNALHSGTGTIRVGDPIEIIT